METVNHDSTGQTFSSYQARPDLEFQTLAQDILIALRGERSQRELSEKMGFSFNQIGKWETGATKVKWDDFFALANVLEIPIEAQFREMFFPVFEGEFTPVTAFNRFVSSTGVDRSFWPHATFKRWQRGTTSPLFSEVLRLLSSNLAMLFSWLHPIVDCTKIESLKKPYAAFLKRADLVFQDPACVYINAALSLDSYLSLPQHDGLLLAEHSACTVEHLRRTLKAMVEFGIITFKDGKYQPCPIDFSFGASRNFKARALMKLSLDLLSSRYTPLPAALVSPYFANPSMGSVRVVATSTATASKIALAVTAFSKQIAQLIAEDKDPKEAVQVIVINSVPANINSPLRGPRSRLREP